MAGEAVLSSVLQELLSKLSSPILDEFGLLWGVKKEKQKLQSNLSRIKAVLQDAERQQIDLMTDKDRLGKLKDVAYDAEDLVDEFLVEALGRKVENQDGMGRKVGNFFSPSNPIAFHFKIAHKMKELRKRFEELAEENNNFQSAEGVARSQPQISNPRETSSGEPDTGVIGRVDEKGNLIDSLLYSGNEEVLSVIPIVGMGGLGKTTLAQYVYDDKRVVSHFNLKMWVYVSEDFDVGRILAKILESATKNTSTDGSSKDLLITRVKENLSGKRYLLVLDDVWNEVYEKWVELRTVLKCGAKGSKILVTTRSDTVARRMDALPRPPLGTMSAAESWTLFEEVAHPPTGFVSIGEEIVRKCGGVPLAIKTLGGMLRNETSEREWQSVRDSELWKRTDNEGGILSIIRLSYDHLTSSLKQCFAYCAVIPKGRRFYKDVLIKQWIAQGFIHSDDENELLEEEGEKYFNALLRRSLFQQVDVGNIYSQSYKMHDLIHDLLKSVAGKECLVVEASMMNDLTRHVALFNDETRHLDLCNDDCAGEPENLDASKKCKKLRSMIIHGPIDINVCLSFRCLRVLDLSYRTSIHFLPNSIDKLRHLRYFDISFTRIEELPETICNLHNLQTLRVLSTRLEKWPKNMKRMISLRHIEFDRGDPAFPLTKGIGELTFLRTLPEFIITKESGAGIEELKDLNLLWGNIHIRGLDTITNVGCAHEADLKAKKHLNSLKLSWSGNKTVAAEGNAKEVIEILEPHLDLKELSVENYTGLGFPSWMTEKLTNLNKISLSSCKRCEWLPPLGKLHSLESLVIHRMDAVKYIVDFDGSHNYKDLFPSLKDLHLRNMPNLEGWSSPQEDGDGDELCRERDKQVIFNCLRTLRIDDCPKLTRPPRLPLLPSLESLQIREMSWDIMEIPTSQSLMKVELDNMPNLERWSPHEADDGTPVIFRSLRTLRIFRCPKLICLPQLLLPALEELGMTDVGCERIEFSTSKSLKKVKLTKMPNLERWSPQEGDDDEQVVFNSLVELVVNGCPRMVRLPHFLPSLEKLYLYDNNEMLLGSLANYTSLSELCIRALPEVKHLPEEFGPNHTSLRELRISNCPKLISLSNQLENLLALKELIVGGCNDLVLSLPDGLQQQQQQQLSPPLNSLEVLKIINSCEKQTSLPGDGIVLPSLKDLRIHSCENIESLSPDMVKNLTRLTITDSSKVWSSLVSLENLKSLEHLNIRECPGTVMMKLLKSMENLTSLTSLSIGNCPGMRSLPESIKTLTAVTHLWIENCPGMKSLPESIKTLTSLTDLSIENCPGMKSLPEGLQRLKNLKWLYIGQCPVLERRVQRNKGQDWHKVAHVPYIRIDRGIPSQDTEGKESSDQCPQLLLHSLKKLKLEKLLPLPSCCSSSPSSSPPPST
ncbi:putative disease resistance protein RGA3 isoform X1 [Cinnamomum micranthum f. kanehirae]|uniref:Putative disease resistance protein RGA3 isoform X1 n=1 Tax=Cinnamomum micranthum f. kanehirae TaxID=337451 RepID=A0A3S3NGH4_9MAGN|nr:putative disease resistance protein RGA3 isoform X1 [Cinnamomum micranthum f. kanehirae]